MTQSQMKYKDLRDFIRLLEGQGELKRLGLEMLNLRLRTRTQPVHLHKHIAGAGD